MTSLRMRLDWKNSESGSLKAMDSVEGREGNKSRESPDHNTHKQRVFGSVCVAALSQLNDNQAKSSETVCSDWSWAAVSRPGQQSACMSPAYDSSSMSGQDSWRNSLPSSYDASQIQFLSISLLIFFSFLSSFSKQRSYNPPLRRASPSPPPLSRRYDSYIPPQPRPGPSFRPEPYPNVYRPTNYRPDSSYYSRSPSPERYPPTDSRDRLPSWQTPAKSSSTWQDSRKPMPPSPTSSVSRDRRSRDSMLATRMFEPSDAWKQSHTDRPHRPDA